MFVLHSFVYVDPNFYIYFCVSLFGLLFFWLCSICVLFVHLFVADVGANE